MHNIVTDNPIHYAGTALFGLAVLHTFATKAFDHLSHRHPRHAGLFHLLGEVEVVFGFWALVLDPHAHSRHRILLRRNRHCVV